MANAANLQANVDAIRCVKQVLSVHAAPYLAPHQAGQLEVRDAQPLPLYSAPTAQSVEAMQQLANRLVEICATAKGLAAAGKDGVFRDFDSNLVAAVVDVFEAGEAHLATQKATYEFAQNELRRHQRSPGSRNSRDHVIECFEDAIDALQSARWAILIADGVDAPPGNRAFTSGQELVEASLAE